MPKHEEVQIPKIILSGGGTGGHIYPALAIAQAIKKKWPRADILYVGTAKGMESLIVPQSGLEFAAFDIEGIPRKISFKAIAAIYKMILATIKARSLILNFKPNLAIGTGGYASLPILLNAIWGKIPSVIHEQNAFPGMANRFLAKKASKVMLSFQEALEHLPEKSRKRAIVTGLPVREDILKTTRNEGLTHYGFQDDLRVVLSLGGSRGARNLNKAMIRVMMSMKNEVQFIHATGQHEYSSFLNELEESGIDIKNQNNMIILPYIQDIGYALACADICVSRAGAAFISEMTAKGVPGILVPYPYATDDHQRYNAAMLAEKGAAYMINDQELTGDLLLERIEALIYNDEIRNTMSAESAKAGSIDAIKNIVELLRQYID